jgi:DNA-binding transcriptional LysR family regulator
MANLVHGMFLRQNVRFDRMLIRATQRAGLKNRYAELQMQLSHVNWDDGRLFLAVARSGQLLAAARTLGLNQATLSRRMTALERDLGAQLLVRRTTGCELTDAGRELAKVLERVESEFLASESRLADRDETLTGTVRIGAPDGFGVSFLAPRLAELADRHPSLNIQLVPVPRAFSLSQREADIAIMVGRPDHGRLVARKLTDYSLSLYASKDYLARHQAPRSAADLAGHHLIGYVEDLLYAPGLAYTDQFWKGWKSRIEIASATGQMEAALAGAGIAILHDYLAAGHPSLKLVLPALRAERTYWIVVHESMRDNARLRVCIDFIAASVKARGVRFVR